MKKYSLEIVVFMCGAVVMAFEITGSRMLGPYVGTSMFVWTSIIGIILLSLSLGYFWGGRIADRRPQAKILAFIILLSGISVSMLTLIKDLLLDYLLNISDNVKIVSVVSSLILFAVPSIFLGMVSPFAARLKLKNIVKSGATVGNLYAISTIGSITGVFLAGFYLIPSFKITSILFMFSIILIITSLFLHLVFRKFKS